MAKNLRQPRLLNMRYYRRRRQSQEVAHARRVMGLVRAKRWQIVGTLSAIALALLVAGGAAGWFLRRLVVG